MAATKPNEVTCDKLMNATDISKLFEINYREACTIVKELVQELKDKRYRVVASNKIPLSYLLERYHMKEVRR